MLSPEEVAKRKPAWAECLSLRAGDDAQKVLAALHSFGQEEIRLRARMMAAVDEGVGEILDALERKGELDNTFILFLGDNGFFFGEHALGPGATLRLRGRHPLAVRRALSAEGSRRARAVASSSSARTSRRR